MALPLLDFFPSPSPSRELADALLFSFLVFSAGSGLNGFLATLIRFPKPDPEFRLALRGGVRIFEGINYLTRDREISPERLAAMHQRAKAAGLAPYGATPEQMHVVEHTPADFVPLDNWWQRAWTTIGVDKLLALIAADI